ncbi:MAG: Rieske 2Fe-2S domain-containing protein [Nitriliruptorales bacterium]|nr:Rieske 2Fe-2S domain-containing protein [Nitriliruptorales bacterium]
MRKPDELVIETGGRFRVHASLYVDDDLFAKEMERIFARTWVYVAHESELPNPGDYRTSVIGTQPVIVARDQDGDVNVMFNRCMHRGATVCRADRGHSNYFRCQYHNWVYNSRGELQGMAQKSGYPDDFDRSELSLVRPAHVASYRGLIFANLDPAAEPLEERLAVVRRSIDAWCDRSPAGRIRVTRGTHRYRYPGNWKLQLENGVDGYHGNYVHESFTKILERSGERSRKDVTRARNDVGSLNYAKGLGRGDGMLERRAGMLGTADYSPYADYHRQLVEAHGRDRVEDILTQRNILVFPNLYLFESHIRVVRPVSTTETIVDNHPTVLEGAPAQLNTDRLREHERFFGPSSFGATDDLEIFVHVQTGAQATAAEWLEMSRGLHREQRNEFGEHVGHSTDEAPQRSIYREWRRLMTAEAEVPV